MLLVTNKPWRWAVISQAKYAVPWSTIPLHVKKGAYFLKCHWRQNIFSPSFHYTLWQSPLPPLPVQKLVHTISFSNAVFGGQYFTSFGQAAKNSIKLCFLFLNPPGEGREGSGHILGSCPTPTLWAELRRLVSPTALGGMNCDSCSLDAQTGLQEVEKLVCRGHWMNELVCPASLPTISLTDQEIYILRQNVLARAACHNPGR